MNKDRYIPGVDGLRAIAVMLVLLFHAGFSQLSGGYVGVDVFFVISGFLITRLIVEEYQTTGRFDFGRFYYRRAKRLLPAMLTTVTITLIVAILLFTPQHLKRFGGEVVYSLFSMSNFFFLSESGYFNTASDFKPLLHTWSLSVEEQFYLVWPATLFVALKLGRKPLAIAGILAIFAISLALNFSFSDGQSFLTIPFGQAISDWLSNGASTIYFFTPMRAFEFCVGAVLVFTPKPQMSKWLFELMMLIGLALIGYSALSFDETTLFPSYNALIPCIGTALAIYSCNSAPLTGSVLKSKPMVFTGLISYSVYLVHWPLIVFTKYWLMRDFATIEKAAIVLVSVAMGYALFKLVETPLRHGAQSNQQAKFGLACAMLAMLIMLPASTIWSSDGWKWRVAPMPTEIEKQLANSSQFHIDQYGGAGYPNSGWVNPQPSGKADIILIGDSHALHYAKGLDELVAKPNNKSIFISSVSCLMLPGMTRVTPDADWDKLCPDNLNTAISIIKESPTNSTVVISHSWGFQLSVAGQFGNNDRIPEGDSDAGYRYISTKIRMLSEAIGSRKLVVIGNVPGSGVQDLAGCFARPKFFKVNCDEKTTSLQDLLPTKSGNETLREEVSKIPNAIYLDPEDVLCKDGKCNSLVNGSVMYSDSSHLSKSGSIAVIQGFLEPLLQEIKKDS